jgi:hypothetical protein
MIRGITLALGCLSGVLSLAAVSPAGAPASREAPKGTVTGIAIDTSGNGVADCVVSATESAQHMRVARTTETDQEGKFSLELPEGSWNLTVTTKDTKLKAVKSVDVENDKTFDLGKITLRPRKVGAR